MAVMDAIGRMRVWIDIMHALLRDEVDISDITVQEAILVAVGTADDWIDVNQSSFNDALPEPFGAWATPRQKAALLAFVLMERYRVNISIPS